MKALIILPLFFAFQLMCSAYACDRSDCSATASTTSATARPIPAAETETPAKKNPSTPTTARPSAPKPHRAARPGYLFM